MLQLQSLYIYVLGDAQNIVFVTLLGLLLPKNLLTCTIVKVVVHLSTVRVIIEAVELLICLFVSPLSETRSLL